MQLQHLGHGFGQRGEGISLCIFGDTPASNQIDDDLAASDTVDHMVRLEERLAVFFDAEFNQLVRVLPRSGNFDKLCTISINSFST
jgi:hypothetical protein